MDTVQRSTRKETGGFDFKFHVFMEVNKLLELFYPEGYQFTNEQADAVHAFAKKLAADMRSGEYV